MKTICWIRWMFLWIQGRDRTLKTGFAKMSRAWSPLKIWRCQSVADASPEEWESEDDSPTCPVIESQNENLDSWPGSLVVCCGRILIWAYSWWLMVTMFRLRFPCHEQMMNRWWMMCLTGVGCAFTTSTSPWAPWAFRGADGGWPSGAAAAGVSDSTADFSGFVGFIQIWGRFSTLSCN